MDDLSKLLPNDPGTQAILEKWREKIKNGEKITQADQIELNNHLNGLPPGTVFPGNPGQIDQQIGSVTSLAEVNSQLQIALQAGGGGPPPIPMGPGQILMVPGLQLGELVLLPDGTLMAGTGGTGNICVITGDVGDLIGIPIGSGEPAPEMASTSTGIVNSGVLLINPEDSGGNVHYVLNNKWDYSMKPASSQRLSTGKTWEIRFDRGDGDRTVRYTLKPGSYCFTSDEDGWDLKHRTFSVVVDNSDNEDAFNYVVDNQHASVPGGGENYHESDYPISLRFDPGDGGKVASKRSNDPESRLLVAVNPKDGLWDLYPAQFDSNRNNIATRDPDVDSRQSRSNSPRRDVVTPDQTANNRTSRLLALLQANNNSAPEAAVESIPAAP